MRSRARIVGGTLAAGLLVVLVVLASRSGLIGPLTASPTGTESAGPSASTPAAPRSSASRPATDQDPESGLRLVDLVSLPAEAGRTVTLIDRGGPFPYAKDGATFGNRERVLPRKASGFYREYTVPTPGEGDRGARRIVTGDQDRQLFYTGDHYATFVRIRR